MKTRLEIEYVFTVHAEVEAENLKEAKDKLVKAVELTAQSNDKEVSIFKSYNQGWKKCRKSIY